MSNAAPWRSHLKPGETIIWSASVSDELRRKDHTQMLWNAIIYGGGSAALALFLLWRAYEAAFLGVSQPDASPGLIIGFSLLAAAGLAALSAFIIRSFLKYEPGADHYAATNLRLLAIDATGKLVQEIPRGEIEGSSFDDRRPPTEMHIFRHNDDECENSFYIGHVENLPAVKDSIRQAFPEAPL